MSANKPPALRAYSVAWEAIKYKESESTEEALIKELENISPIKKGKRTGFFNEETVEYYNAIMTSFEKDGILRKPIFVGGKEINKK